MSKPEKITIDDVEYVRADRLTPEVDANYVIIRTYSAGVHAGYLESQDGKIVKLNNSRRIYYWAGAATLSQLAVDGTSKPGECKFPCAVPEITLTEAIEIIPCTMKARKSIQSVKVWSE